MKLICHMISSVDGRLYPARWGKPQAAVPVTEVYETTAVRFNADGWIVGRTTMADYDDGVREEAPAALRAASDPAPEPFVLDRGGRLVALAVDLKGRLHFSHAVLPTGEQLAVVLSPKVGEAHLAHLREAGISYVFAGEGGTDAERLGSALKAIEAELGVKTLLLEGGGIINGAFLKAGLIDEISVLVYPGLDALHGVSSIFEAAGASDERPAEHAHLTLIEAKPLEGGVVWLHYAVQND